MTDTARLTAALAGRYGIERQLGAGGMATVYLARDLKHGREVAVKVLRPELAVALGPERFLREIELAARLAHPHILAVYDSGEAEGFLYYVMPYVDGESLRDRLDHEHRLPLEDALTITREVADALTYAHRHDVVHRDIKPENILFQAGHAVVSDFGIARAISAAGGPRLTKTGIAVGTPAYMSPEQAAGEDALDGRSDVYSLACVLYEMLAGRPPFKGPTAESVLHQHLTAEPPAVSDIRGGVPAGVAAASRRALAKARGDRFATAREFAEALASPSSTVAEPIGRPRRRAFIAAGWVVAVAIATAVGLAVRARVHASGVIAPAATLVVIPFAPATPDTALQRLGRELTITLTSNLDGVGGIRAVDALTVLAQASDPNAAYSLERGAAVARRLGARSLIHGSLLRLGPNVRLDLGLFDSESMSPIARASVMAPPEDITALTDSATWALLHQVWQRGEPPSPSLAAVTTRSVPALRAFLEGERWFATGDWGPAAREYGQAMEADSTFWLAYWRYAYVKEVWLSEPVDTAIQSAFRAHLSVFPERDRLLIAATRTQNTTAAIGLMRTVTERFPEYWPGWWSYADMLVHVAPFLGTGYADARDALDRVVALNPDLVVGWNHLFWIAAHQRDTAATAHALRELTRLGWHGKQPYVHLQYLDRLLRTGGTPEAGFTDSVARLVAAYRPPTDPVGGASMFGFPRAEVDVARRALSLRPPADIAEMQRLNLALAWAQRGAWDSALVAAREYVHSSPGRGAALYGYRLAVMGAWLGALDSGAVAGWRAIAARSIEELPPEGRAEVAWLDGVVAVARRKRPDLVAARQALRRSGAPSTPILDRSLAALELELAGDRRRATDSLDRFEVESAERGWFRSVGCDHPYVSAIDRLTAARWLASASDRARAAQLLRWNEALSPRPYCFADPVERILSPLASLEQGRVEDALGHAVLAQGYYSEFLTQYDMPVAAHRHLIEEARAAIARLGAEPR